MRWDDGGRLAERHGPSGGHRYGYDHNDQLVEVVRSDGVRLEYIYDPLGRRIAEIVGDASTWFGWDGDAIVEESGSDGSRRRRVFAADGYTPVMELEEDGVRLVASDHAATPFGFLTPEGGLSRLELTTWGEVATQDGAESPLRFAGQRHDGTTGLHYNRFRYYAPDLHVFTTPDPLGIDASWQEIGFVHNPTFVVDPLGLLTIHHGVERPQTQLELLHQLSISVPRRDHSHAVPSNPR